MRERVVVYVERRAELLAFDHRDHPEARTQVPAGGVEPEYPDGLGRPARTRVFRVPAPRDLPDAWGHVVSGRGDDADLVFLCRFDTAPHLWPAQAVYRPAVDSP